MRIVGVQVAIAKIIGWSRQQKVLGFKLQVVERFYCQPNFATYPIVVFAEHLHIFAKQTCPTVCDGVYHPLVVPFGFPQNYYQSDPVYSGGG